MDSTESRGRRILLQAFAMCIQIILLVALFVFVPSDDGIWFLYSLFLSSVIAASWIFVFSRILNGTFRQGSAADLVIGAIAILLFYTIPAGISLLWLHHSLNPRDSTVNKNSDFADAKISVFTEPGEDRKSMMHRLKRLNEFVYLISATDVALLMFFVLTSTHFLFSASTSIYSKTPNISCIQQKLGRSGRYFQPEWYYTSQDGRAASIKPLIQYNTIEGTLRFHAVSRRMMVLRSTTARHVLFLGRKHSSQ